MHKSGEQLHQCVNNTMEEVCMYYMYSTCVYNIRRFVCTAVRLSGLHTRMAFSYST